MKTTFASQTTIASDLAKRSVRLGAALALGVSSIFSHVAVAPDHAAAADQRNYIKLSTSDARKTKTIDVGLNKSMVVDLPADAHDILVADPEVADAITRTSRRIYVFGKKIGQTNIFIFDGRGKQIASLDILIERDISGLESTIRRLIPNSDVKAEMINDSMILTGYVATPADAATAARLAKVFVEGREINNAQTLASAGVQGAPGAAPTTATQEEENPIINMLKIDGEDQVHLKVVIAEIQRSVVKQLGIEPSIFNASENIGNGPNNLISDLFNAKENGTDGFGFQAIGGSAPVIDAFGVGEGRFEITNAMGSFGAKYRAMERTGVMRTLAEPSLTAISGEKGHFRVGGSYSVPSSVSASGTVEMDVIDYGIALTFTPVVLTQGRISLKIRTEVSEPTSQNVLALNSRVNLLNVRKRLVDTTVELPSGGSMVIGGLVQDNIRQAVSGQPVLKDIPFFGALFRSREFLRNESEVVIFVTPYLVKPVNRRALARPDKNFDPASDSAGYLLGRINRVYGTKKGKLPKGRYTGSVGFIFK